MSRIKEFFEKPITVGSYIKWTLWAGAISIVITIIEYLMLAGIPKKVKEKFSRYSKVTKRDEDE